VQTETELQKTIIKWLDYLPNGFFWEHYTTGIPCYNPRTKARYNRPLPERSRFTSDILGIYKAKFCAIEVKTVKEYKFVIKHYARLLTGPLKTKRDIHLNGQIAFIENIKLKGGIGGFVCDIDTTKKLLDCIN